MTATIWRWALDDYGRAKLRLRSEPAPEPGPGEVLVRVAAASSNRRDVMMTAEWHGFVARLALLAGI